MELFVHELVGGIRLLNHTILEREVQRRKNEN